MQAQQMSQDGTVYYENTNYQMPAMAPMPETNYTINEGQ